jgi:hypothetical protein
MTTPTLTRWLPAFILCIAAAAHAASSVDLYKDPG